MRMRHSSCEEKSYSGSVQHPVSVVHEIYWRLLPTKAITSSYPESKRAAPQVVPTAMEVASVGVAKEARAAELEVMGAAMGAVD